MSYGAEIFNEAGAKVFDGFDTMYLRASGLTINNIVGAATCITNNQSGALNVRKWISYQYHNFNGFVASECDHVVSTSLRTIRAGLNTWIYCDNIIDSNSELAFVSIPPEGILHMCMVNWDLPELNPGAALLVSTGRFAAPLQYRIFSKNIPFSSETYGMQLFNSAGDLTFDSRPKILGFEFFRISTSQVQDVLINNAVIDLTLAKPNPNAFVSSSDWTCGNSREVGGVGNGNFVKITQLNSTTLRLSRQRYGNGLGDYPITAHSDYHPMTLLVARGD